MKTCLLNGFMTLGGDEDFRRLRPIMNAEYCYTDVTHGVQFERNPSWSSDADRAIDYLTLAVLEKRLVTYGQLFDWFHELNILPHSAVAATFLRYVCWKYDPTGETFITAIVVNAKTRCPARAFCVWAAGFGHDASDPRAFLCEQRLKLWERVNPYEVAVNAWYRGVLTSEEIAENDDFAS